MKLIFFVSLVISSQMLIAEELVEGVFMVVRGSIKLERAQDHATAECKVGSKVNLGDILISGPSSYGKIEMPDRSIIVLGSDTRFSIQQYREDNNQKTVELKLDEGLIRARVEQKYDGEKSTFNVMTPSLVAGVRGTDFSVGYDSKIQKAEIVTFEGTVAVGERGPRSTILNPVYVQKEHVFSHLKGQKIERPRELSKSEIEKRRELSSLEERADHKGNSPQEKKHLLRKRK